MPTEAKWEYAARGGLKGKRYPWGDEISHDNANYSGTGGRDKWSKCAPVSSLEANGYGLYDMVGNVWEWCSDWDASDYYSNSPPRNPQGPSTGEKRVLRGGSHSICVWLAVASTISRIPAASTVFVVCQDCRTAGPFTLVCAMHGIYRFTTGWLLCI